MKDSYNKIFNSIDRVLVILAHPDDLEIFCGGLVARLIADGKEIRAISVTNGNKGMHQQNFTVEEFRKIRLESQKRAGVHLGLKPESIINLDIPDGQVEDTYENIGKLVIQIREFQPDIIITHNPQEFINHFSKNVRWVNHRDHRKTASMAFDAGYPYSADHGFFPEHIKQGLRSCLVTKFLMTDCFINDYAVGFDITDYREQKLAGLREHMAGNVLSQEEVDGFMEEVVKENGSFEVLGYVEVG